VEDVILKAIEDTIFVFCRRWKIRELALFGSILRDDFGPESDIDFLVEFEPDANWSLLDHIQMEQELSELLGREVHLISKRALEYTHNYIFRQEVLGTVKVVFSSEGSSIGGSRNYSAEGLPAVRTAGIEGL
jgi:predicted nucleotidyltransferase